MRFCPQPSKVGPSIITLPGLGGSGPAHWQTLWERARPDTVRAELGTWDAPHRNSWVGRLDDAVRRAGGPVVFAAHSLGCLVVAWWAQLAPQDRGSRVKGALLVAPPDVDRGDAPTGLHSFAPVPVAPLPFASILVASENDPWTALGRARGFAEAWGSELVDVGAQGHLNADSGLGAWPEGEELLERLVAGSRSPPRPKPAARRYTAGPGRSATARHAGHPGDGRS